MEKSVYNKLTSKDKELLGTLFDSETIKSIFNAIDIYQRMKSAHVTLNAPDWANVLQNRGNIEGSRFVYDLCSYAHSKQKKEIVTTE